MHQHLCSSSTRTAERLGRHAAVRLDNAARACEQPSQEAFEGYVRELTELMAARRGDLRPIHISTCFHRLSRAAVVYTNVSVFLFLLNRALEQRPE